MSRGVARTVPNDGVPLACVDHGGSGPDLVLMHGAGMGQHSLDKLAGHLVRDFRVVTFDFRGHGQTPPAPWTMDTAVSDLEVVIAAYGLTRPAVAGHSLGGMVAAEYARRHPECAAAVNIDGHGQGTPEQYVGKDPEQVAAWMVECQEQAAAVMDSRLVKALVLLGRLRGATPADKASVTAITEMVTRLDLFAIYREVAVPLQVFNAHAPRVGLTARLMKDPEGYADAFRAGIGRDLAALAEVNPRLEPAEIDATHSLIRTHPEQTAGLMAGFLQRHVA